MNIGLVRLISYNAVERLTKSYNSVHIYNHSLSSQAPINHPC